MHMRVKWIIKKKCMAGTFYQFHDGGRSKCRVRVEFWIVFKQTKNMGKSGIHHHKEVCRFNYRSN